jgi:glycosyltransferase involved in cell wall biosynthesis
MTSNLLNKSIKLLYITNGINGSGGLERVLSIKASYLSDKLNYDVHILTLNDGDKNPFFKFSENIDFHDVKIKGSKPFGFFASYKKGISKILAEVEPDVISVCDDGLKGVLFPLIFGKDIPVVYERHVSRRIEVKSDNPTTSQKLLNYLKFKLMNFAASKFDKFIVLTNGSKNEWQIDNIAVIPNPMPFELVERSTLSSKTVLVVGKQSYQKGYDRLLEVWKLVTKKYNDWKLEVYGKLDPSLGLELKSEQLGISDKVTFYPPTKKIHEKYKEASLYLMTSRFEGFGMVLIEAMSYGVPCVAFDCPYGPSDIISDRKDGFVIKNGDIQAFSNAVIELIEQEDLRQTMGNNAAENVRRYNIDEIWQQWDELFKEMER